MTPERERYLKTIMVEAVRNDKLHAKRLAGY